MATVLLIEDDQRIRESLARGLAARGHDVRSAAAGMLGVEQALSDEIDLIVLDIGLPDVSGLEVMRMVRSLKDIPILVATAQDDEPEIVKAFDAGADDYVVKPFSAEHLDARIKAVLRRSSPPDEAETLHVGELVVETRSHRVTFQDEHVELTPKEFELLRYLAERPGTVVSKRKLMAEVWRQPYGGADKTVDVHVSWLRKKLGESASEPRYLHTLRGVGIKLVDPTV